MDHLGRALDRAAEGRGGAILVSGEAGVGKTRLLTEFVATRGAGATVLVGGCLALADGAGPHLPAAGASPVTPAEAELGLTRRELEVLRLVAQGQTNREVATTLFISEKTAGVHVSNILRKLDLRSRVEASAYAHRLGLLDEPTA